MAAARAIDRYFSREDVRGTVSETILIPEQKAVFGVPEAELHTHITGMLGQLGIERLFAHQAQALDAALAGKNVAVVTGTNSGKTMCYNLPVVHTCLTEPLATALYIYPTKALAQDQLGKFEMLAEGTDLRAAVYDGDTPRPQRRAIRKSAHVVLTNPDMLHIGIVPGHESWRRFLKRLRFIVIDEMHTYRGVFGSHVAGVLRRLLRICEFYGASPTVIACSATVANPLDLFEALTGREAELIDQDGAQKGERSIVLVLPPDPGEAQRYSPNFETARLLAELVAEGVRVMAFCKSRVATELVVRYAREALSEAGEDPAGIESYRGGYTAEERREIEQQLFEGRISGIVSTNAMELGVDVGGLDAVLLNGYPGNRASFWQQVGRAGRSTRPGAAVMFAHEDPLEQYLARNPEALTGDPVEGVSLNPENRFVLAAQIGCAAYERPLSLSDLDAFGRSAQRIADEMASADELQFSAERYFLPSYDNPAAKVNIRGSGDQKVELRLEGQAITEMELWRALQYAHEGAVYMHRAETFLVTSLDLQQGVAELERAEPDYFTRPVVQALIEPILDLQRDDLPGCERVLSGLKVTTIVSGFRSISRDGWHVVGEQPLKLPPQTIETIGILVELPGSAGDDAVPAVHGVEHALITTAPLIAGCDTRDLGSAWYAIAPDTLAPRVAVFDQVAGSTGLCEQLLKRWSDWLAASLSLLETCDCEDGCPRCLFTSRCEISNNALSKPLAVRLLRSMQKR
ncbi:MAG: DEAD/DEAH box helicase [Armatimonadetes bacterium]|nr:DEAD/DEAH box helicase [Armatimonadota bacterium]